MPRTFDDAWQWMQSGTQLFAAAAASLGDEVLGEPSTLPAWTRAHVTAHVAANADALGRLVHWAATGQETPMYASPEDRAAEIVRGAMLPAPQLRDWLSLSAEELRTAMSRLGNAGWNREVRTAQGRTVPAAELPWIRAREVCVHAVDLDAGISFADLPAGFLASLCAEVMARRGLTSAPAHASTVPLGELAAYLTGRPHHVQAPELGPWL